jgi:hypothetical protein
MQESAWEQIVAEGIYGPTPARFTVFLDGLEGTSAGNGVRERVLRAVVRTEIGIGGATDRELHMLYEARKLHEVQFVIGGVPRPNPFSAITGR